MNVLVAIDSFKGSLSSNELADTIESGIHEILDESGVELKIIRLDTKLNPEEEFGKIAGREHGTVCFDHGTAPVVQDQTV